MIKGKKINNISFIASTLPIRFILENYEELSIDTIYVPTKKLFKSAKYIRNLSSEKINLKLLSENKFFQLFHLAFLFIKSKAKNNKVIFFHEISWVLFDITFHWIKPKYKFFPQVTLNSHSTFDQIPRSRMKNKYIFYKLLNKFLYLFGRLNLLPRFKLLFYENDDCDTNNITYSGSFSCQNYKISQITNNTNFSIKGNSENLKKIIILCGADIVSKTEQKLVLNKIVKLILKKNIKVDLKGHPNWGNIYPDVNKDIEDISKIDKYIPFELIDDSQYHAIVGISSTVLARYPQKSISIIYFFKSISMEFLNKRVTHLKSLDKNGDCKYPKNEKQLNNIIDELINNK